MSNTPSDAELQALWEESDHPLPQNFARAVLAKWGTPQPVVREPLTDDQLREAAKHYCIHANQTRAFIIGAHFAELTHGIKPKGGS